ncbi:MAG: peptide-methionine (S)-S-oxide reductase MsrA [Dehalogenimonas sp.]|uniref:Peptide methionine sulfoxide reductase MsrA n=1 Tax=Candidatus Dehalogenimonas loeffleri TaxID=3127115 RepID=A0ABZ2J537_9CHLR|nr:peptide-methionine (S)-S-oxide reductase MsrA [Dehalogenimonas sp.]
MEVAVFAGGCFWCLEEIFRRLKGVNTVTSGYTGGHSSDPDYKAVCTGSTGHAEAVRIEFEPDTISYQELLNVFFAAHDPTTLNRQGADVGSQYRSAIFFTNELQKSVAENTIADLNRGQAFPKPLVTELQRLATFYPAEKYHQSYYQQHANQPYCRAVIEPKLKKLFKD